jgi:hypothetical protein
VKAKPIHENDEELVARALIVASWLPCKIPEIGKPMSLHVSLTFGIDKQQAEALCRRFQYDPDMMIRKR